jgi:hypothetical protein
MAFLEIHYEGLDKPLVIDDVDYSCALGIRRTNQYGNAIDSWHGLVGATKVRLVVGRGESLLTAAEEVSPRPFGPVRKRGVLILLGVVLVCCSSSASAARTDRPRIVPWHQIGDIWIGMSRRQLVSEYGRGKPLMAGYPDAGAVYPTLSVEFTGGTVTTIRTYSRRYRTPDGFGVGSRIPHRPCYCWNGFRPDFHEHWWSKTVTWNGRKFTAFIYVDDNYSRVTGLQLGGY